MIQTTSDSNKISQNKEAETVKENGKKQCQKWRRSEGFLVFFFFTHFSSQLATVNATDNVQGVTTRCYNVQVGNFRLEKHSNSLLARPVWGCDPREKVVKCFFLAVLVL